MNKLLYIFVLIMTFSFALQMNAEEIKMPGLGISNKCDTLFPINSRINYNQPQYQLGYDRCMIAYNAYSGTLNQIIIDWKVAYQTNKVEDFEKVANGFQSLYETIVVNGESLTNWIARDLLLGDITLYVKKVNSEIESAKLKAAEKYWTIPVPNLIVPKKDLPKEGIGSSTTTVLMKDVCKPGFILVQKTGNCRKILKKRIITPVI